MDSGAAPLPHRLLLLPSLQTQTHGPGLQVSGQAHSDISLDTPHTHLDPREQKPDSSRRPPEGTHTHRQTHTMAVGATKPYTRGQRSGRGLACAFIPSLLTSAPALRCSPAGPPISKVECQTVPMLGAAPLFHPSHQCPPSAPCPARCSW